ncbi:hypothetical protein L218DRAFT_386195 [Marasmius fiardii PR-910]|nr:hypothetical protein L218DRAFT_386195 [Marasmius fiardii PR-910]
MKLVVGCQKKNLLYAFLPMVMPYHVFKAVLLQLFLLFNHWQEVRPSRAHKLSDSFANRTGKVYKVKSMKSKSTTSNPKSIHSHTKSSTSEQS